MIKDLQTELFQTIKDSVAKLQKLEQQDVDDLCFLTQKVRKLQREINVLRNYGNKDCTAQADAKLAELALED